MSRNLKISILFYWFFFFSLASISVAYRPGDIVPMTKMGQYHSQRTVWHDMIGRQCPVFGVNREVLVPLAKPTGYTGADPYKISFQVGKEKFLIPWLLVINRKGPEVPMIEVNLGYSGNDLHGVTAKVVDMPHHYVEVHPNIRTQFWSPEHWPKHVLVRYTWEEHSEIDVPAGFYVLFGSGLAMSFILAIYVLQSSRDKLARSSYLVYLYKPKISNLCTGWQMRSNTFLWPLCIPCQLLDGGEPGVFTNGALHWLANTYYTR